VGNNGDRCANADTTIPWQKTRNWVAHGMIDLVMDFIALVFGWLVYGTARHPRHPILRNSVRLIALGGGLFILGWMILPNSLAIPFMAFLFWGICFAIVLAAEAELGSARIAIAAWVLAAILTLVLFGKQWG
jgi:hypothetical protein